MHKGWLPPQKTRKTAQHSGGAYLVVPGMQYYSGTAGEGCGPDPLSPFLNTGNASVAEWQQNYNYCNIPQHTAEYHIENLVELTSQLFFLPTTPSLLMWLVCQQTTAWF